MPTEIPPVPTNPPPGSAANPLNLYLVAPGEPSNLAQEVEAIRDALAEATGLIVEVHVAESYAFVLEGLCRRSVHMGTLDAFSYLAASERGCVTPVSLAERDGQTGVQGQLIANTATFVTTVEGFDGRRFCRPDAASAYGWILPGLTLRARGIDPLNELAAVVDAGSDAEVVRLVHDRDCDVGATLLGAEETVDDLEFPERVALVETLTPIPNDVLVFGSAVSEAVRDTARGAFEEAEGSLAAVMGSDALIAARDSDFDDLRDVFAAAGVDVVLLGR